MFNVYKRYSRYIKKGFTVRELLGETEYTKVMAKIYGIKVEPINKK